MEQEMYWERFQASGSVADYLKYRQELLATASKQNFDETKELADDTASSLEKHNAGFY